MYATYSIIGSRIVMDYTSSNGDWLGGERTFRILIGDYTIESSGNEGMIWMCHVSGEGMEIPEAKLAAALKRFYAETF